MQNLLLEAIKTISLLTETSHFSLSLSFFFGKKVYYTGGGKKHQNKTSPAPNSSSKLKRFNHISCDLLPPPLLSWQRQMVLILLAPQTFGVRRCTFELAAWQQTTFIVIAIQFLQKRERLEKTDTRRSNCSNLMCSHNDIWDKCAVLVRIHLIMVKVTTFISPKPNRTLFQECEKPKQSLLNQTSAQFFLLMIVIDW